MLLVPYMLTEKSHLVKTQENKAFQSPCNILAWHAQYHTDECVCSRAKEVM
jgi:hypothetical protein